MSVNSKVSVKPSAKDVAARLGIGERQARNLIRDGDWRINQATAPASDAPLDTDSITMESAAETVDKWAKFESARKNKIANDIKAGALIKRAEHERELMALAEAVNQSLREFPTRLAPELAGLSVAEIEARLLAEADDIRRRCRAV